MVHMTISEIAAIVAPFVGIGFLLGCMPLMAGLGVLAIINIFKKI